MNGLSCNAGSEFRIADFGLRISFGNPQSAIRNPQLETSFAIRRLRARISAARSAASLTNCPIFGCDGSISTGKSSLRSISLVVGPIDATTMLRKPARTSSTRPSSSASFSRLNTWLPDVNIATSISPAAMRRIFCSSGPQSSGRAQSYT